MKKLLLLLLLPTLGFSQESTEFKTYSYSEFVQMIESETDSVFKLSDALIKINYQTDSLFGIKYFIKDFTHVPIRKDTLIIDIPIYLDNVHFENPIFRDPGSINFGNLALMRFKEKVEIRNSAAVHLVSCQFDKLLTIQGSGTICKTLQEVEIQHGIKDNISIGQSLFEDGLKIFINCNYQDEIIKTEVSLNNNVFKKNHITNSSLEITGYRFGGFNLSNNRFADSSFVSISNWGSGLFLYENNFGKAIASFHYPTEAYKGFYSENNVFENTCFLDAPVSIGNELNLSQFQGGLILGAAWERYAWDLLKEDGWSQHDYNQLHLNDSILNQFLNEVVISNLKYFELHASDLGKLYDFYKAQHNSRSANKIFIDLKDLETERLAFEYQETPSFDTYFQWKINQFLRLFADYGTKPSKAIVFGMYVIAFFAAIYLFFPNSWDGQGRTRIMNRFRFFLKYLKQDEGVKEVYLQEKELELVPFEEFKSYFEEHGKKAPRFFYATAIPLYRWSVSGTRFVSWFLSKVDVLKGTWENTPKSKRWLKSTLVIGAFLIALTYDLFIKVLNAVMLSINTFTTLGFGEIPIKGLPRYLAIIQGFIGWFMLTIFSVSLISQLLN